MARAASQSTQFFLGVGGNQTGPFTEEEVKEQIRQKVVPSDALVWYEGLPDWQPISSIEYFAEDFGGSAPEPRAKASTTPGGFKPLDEEPESADTGGDDDGPAPIQTGAKRKKARGKGAAGDYSTFASGDRVATVFSDEGAFSGSGKKTNKVGLLFMLLVVSVGGGGFYLHSTGQLLPMLGMEEPAAFVPPKATPGAAATAAAEKGNREARARRALSELLLKSDESIRILTEVARENPDDGIGNEAIRSLVDYFKQRKRMGDAGRLLMETKRPKEAAEFFLAEPPSYEEAEPALFAAYATTTEPSRREFLVKDINLLLGPLKNLALATERIKLLEKDFPRERHPFGYYLKTPDQKIADLFQRISFHFVQSLLAHLMSEMPQINFVSRPLVEIKKDKKGGYRVVGSYKGDINLSQDNLKGIRFTFWLFNEQWAVVDTNLTIERERFSRQERKRREGEVLPADKMLSYMEETFKTLFPSSALHETVAADKVVGKKPKLE